MATNYPPLTFNYLQPNGVQVPMIGTPQNNLRPFSNGGCGPTGVQGMSGLGCGGGCGCASCSGGGGALNGLGNVLAGVGRRSLRGLALGQMDDTQVAFALPRWAQVAMGLFAIVGVGSGAYHGYKRHERRGAAIGWAIGWALLGGMFPVITIPISLAQGYGKPMPSGSNSVFARGR